MGREVPSFRPRAPYFLTSRASVSEAEVEPAVREEELTHSGASEELLAQSEELDHHPDKEADSLRSAVEPIQIRNVESIPESIHPAMVELEWFQAARCLGAILLDDWAIRQAVAVGIWVHRLLLGVSGVAKCLEVVEVARLPEA